MSSDHRARRALRILRFQLVIETGPEGGYTLHVHSPRGEGRAPFVPPFTLAEADTFAAALRQGARDVDAGGDRATTRSLVAVGEQLFSALFQGKILQLYQSSLDLLEGDSKAKLRLEILLDPRDPRLAGLQRLPWELLRQPGTAEALALSRRRPLVRYLVVPRPVNPARRPAVLRILAVCARPRNGGLQSLDLGRELRNLQDAVASARSNGTLEIVEPEAPTLAALRRALLDKDCHVLHFMGHGGTVPGQGERVLFFENEAGGADPVRGTDLVNKLAGFPTLRLVVLNACRSATTPEVDAGASFDPFAGVATSLVLGGLPAVVAMRSPISDDAAIAFSHTFYQRLAAGDPVDAAVVEGRQALHSTDPAGFDWAIPVLFMRTPNGELYPEADIPAEKPPLARWLRRLAAALLALTLTLGAWFGVRAWRAQSLVSQGIEFVRHEQWRDARKAFLTAVHVAPWSAKAHSNFAIAEEHFNYLSTAEKEYRLALRLEPKSAEHLYNLGSFLNRQRRYPEAYERLQSAVKMDSSPVDAYSELASAATGLGWLDQARAALTTALQLEPARPTVHRVLGELELNADRPGAAIGHLEEAFRRYPFGDRRKMMTLSLLVQAYDQLGDQLATCREAGKFRRLDSQAVTPWADEVQKTSARRACPPDR